MSGLWIPTWAVARKELRAYFGSPLALIFIGVFLAATLFLFFWAETFFARNIADVRPLFRWMPVLMVLLVATLTMRQWSEEQRAGTLEVLLTLPVRTTHLALGKFVAVVILLATALVLTLSIPVTVELLGDLDWGPAIGGYLGVLLMGSAYAAIGLFVSSRTDNQIVSLILTVLLGGLLYLVGTETVTVFAGGGVSEILRGIGSGSRFESIERGVIDLRDIVYYGSVAALFLALNVVSLETKRWSRGADAAPMRRGAVIGVVLIGINLLLLNVWLFPLAGLRVDLTAQREYSLTAPTKDVISNLEEPLLLRGYISDRTHPLLEPLVPTIRDLLREYEIASRGKIEAEVVDPRTDEAIEAEANRSYGIQSTPFTIRERRGCRGGEFLLRHSCQVPGTVRSPGLCRTGGGRPERQRHRGEAEEPGVRPDQRDQEGCVRLPETRRGVRVAGGAAAPDRIHHRADTAGGPERGAGTLQDRG